MIIDWKTEKPPRDGRFILAYHGMNSQPRLLRLAWVDETGAIYAEPDIWIDIPQETPHSLIIKGEAIRVK